MQRISNQGLVAALLLIVGVASVHGQATVYTWSATDAVADWNVEANWTGPAGNFIPNADQFAGEGALINNGRTVLADVKVPRVAGLEVRNGGLDIPTGGTVEVITDDQGAGNLSIGAAGTVQLSGTGQLLIAGNTTNSGTLRITGAQGQASVGGDFVTSGSLVAGINGENHTAIDVGGNATLGGSLQVDLSGIEPAFGQSWGLVNAGTLSGTFARVQPGDAPPLQRGLQYQVNYTDNSAALEVGNALVLTVDRQSGAGKIENVAGSAIDITGYALRSDQGLLSADNWTSGGLGDAWVMANPTTNHLAELNLTGSANLDVGASIDLGSPYNGGPVQPADEDLFFEYSTVDGRLDQGLVEYTGTALNDIVLHVDPEDGSAAIGNLSQFIAAPDITSYAVRSASGGLAADNWTSLSDSGAGGTGWSEANPTAEHVAELNLSESLTLINGTLLSLGTIFSPSADRDLLFEYTTVDGELLTGTVQYDGIPIVGGITGDCNGDGQLTSADLICVSNIVERDAVLTAIGSLPGDLDGDGNVGFPDFLTVSANFGQDGLGYSEGNVDLEGTVGFPDFLVLSANFGQVPGAAAAAVPEPSTSLMWSLAVVILVPIKRRRMKHAT